MPPDGRPGNLTAMRPRLFLAALAGIAGLALMGSASAGAATRTCHGLPVTVTASKGRVVGTARRDVIALRGPATVRAGAGDDIICGSRFRDVIDAGPGRDIVVGRGGHDVLRGGRDTDHLFGEGGNDVLDGGPGRDRLVGGSGRDHVAGSRRISETEEVGEQVAGTAVLSVVVNPQTVVALSEMGSEFGIAWSPVGSPDGMPTLPLMWTAFEPFPQNVVTLDGQLSVYMIPLQIVPLPGALIDVNLARTIPIPVSGAASVLVTSPGALQVAPQATGITVQSLVNQWLTVGLARSVYANGVTRQGEPMSIADLLPYGMIPLRVPTQPTLFVAPLPQVPSGGFMALIPEPNIVLTPAPGAEVVSVSFDINAGFRQD